MVRARLSHATSYVTVWTLGAAGILEMPARREPTGLFSVQVEFGEPPRRSRVVVDTASTWLWVDRGAAHAAAPSNTSDLAARPEMFGHVKHMRYPRGDVVDGVSGNESVRLGEVETESASWFMASGNRTYLSSELRGEGVLGLAVPFEQDRGPGSFFRPAHRLLDTNDLAGSFFYAFFNEHPEVTASYRLDLGGSEPRVVVGEPAAADDGLKLLATTFATESSLWYVPLRAMGLSQGSELVWNVDFNRLLVAGAPALLDSGSTAIVLNSAEFAAFFMSLPSSCEMHRASHGIVCPCEKGRIDDDFPSISLSFETTDNWRLLGLDFGADTIMCIPPSLYIHPIPGAATSADASDGVDRGLGERRSSCSVAIADGGGWEHQVGVVLGAPFFEAVTVFADVQQRQVGIRDFGGTGTRIASGKLLCADPKNWWHTGMRFSLKRCVVVIIGAFAIMAYVYIIYDPSPQAERLRVTLGCPTEPGLQGLQARWPLDRPGQHGGSPPHTDLPGGGDQPGGQGQLGVGGGSGGQGRRLVDDGERVE